MAFSEFYEKLFGIKLYDHQKKMLEDYYQNSNKKFMHLPPRNGRIYIDTLYAAAKVWYGLYEEGESKWQNF